MESDSFAFRTGAFIVGAGILLALTIGLLGQTREATLPYVVYTTESVSGLDEQSRVYYKGVEVGTVTEIGFSEDDYNEVRILIEVDESIPLGEKTYAQLNLRGITGEFDLVLDNEDELGKPLSTSEDNPAEIPMRTQLITRLGETLEKILEEISGLSENLQKFVSDENVARLEELLDNASNASKRFVELQDQASDALEDLPEAIDNVSGAMDEFQRTARSFNDRTEGLDSLIASVNETSTALSEVLVSLQGGTLVNVEETVLALRNALREISELAEFLKRDPQSLLLGPPKPELGPGEQPRERDQ